MKLNIAERIGILNIIPREGNFAHLKIIRDIDNTCAPSEEDFELYGIEVKPGEDGTPVMSWNPERSTDEKEIEIGKQANVIIVTALKKLNDDKKLTQQQLSLYEKFVEEEDEED
jgi:hypothetical protein